MNTIWKFLLLLSFFGSQGYLCYHEPLAWFISALTFFIAIVCSYIVKKQEEATQAADFVEQIMKKYGI